MTKKEIKERDRLDSIERLKHYIKPGDRLYTVLRHVSGSGMSRVIDVKVLGMMSDGKMRLWDVGHSVAQAIGMKWDDKLEGIGIGGAGMDMGFYIVYNLSRTLFPEFECLGEDCPSNDHVNGKKQKKGDRHSDGGYALTQSWI